MLIGFQVENWKSIIFMIQYSYLEVIDYQLFVVNTVEKWIGCYLWVYGKWRFNDFNLLWRANVWFGWQNEGREEK